MRVLAIRLLRRLAVALLILAVLLLAAPRVLSEMGLLGPSAGDEIREAAEALAAARAYGAGGDLPAFAGAAATLERARAEAERGERRAAKRSAREARRLAIDAQRRILAARKLARRRAQEVVREIEARVDELESLHTRVAPGLPAADRASLLSLMKGARRVAAGLWLSFEEGDYDRVRAEREAVLESLAAAAEALHRAGAQAGPGGST